jgi:hypothetical protein
LAERFDLPLNFALETLRRQGFLALKSNTVVNPSAFAGHLKTAKEEYERQRPLQPIRFPEAKPTEPQSTDTGFVENP